MMIIVIIVSGWIKSKCHIGEKFNFEKQINKGYTDETVFTLYRCQHGVVFLISCVGFSSSSLSRFQVSRISAIYGLLFGPWFIIYTLFGIAIEVPELNINLAYLRPAKRKMEKK